jgi:hypothetical protein
LIIWQVDAKNRSLENIYPAVKIIFPMISNNKKVSSLLSLFSALSIVVLLVSKALAIDPATLPQVGYHPGGLNYWSTPYFANALSMGNGWLEHAPWERGAAVDMWNNPQFNANGYPRYLNSGLELRAIIYPLHANYGDLRPNTWLRRSVPAEGHVALAWQGRADIRLGGGTYLGDESSGPPNRPYGFPVKRSNYSHLHRGSRR